MLTCVLFKNILLLKTSLLYIYKNVFAVRLPSGGTMFKGCTLLVICRVSRSEQAGDWMPLSSMFVNTP